MIDFFKKYGKKIVKYTLNFLAITNALLIGILPIWGIDGAKLTETISVIIAVLSTYLLGDKGISKIKGGK